MKKENPHPLILPYFAKGFVGSETHVLRSPTGEAGSLSKDQAGETFSNLESTTPLDHFDKLSASGFESPSNTEGLSMLEVDEQNQRLTNFYKNLPVLVTGGAGFIGSHLVEKLVEIGAHVTVLDNLSTGNLDNLAIVIDRITLIENSITNREACLQASHGVRAIFHLAAATSVPESIEKPDFYHDVNVTGTINILEAARRNNVPNLIFSSSSAVYGDTSELCTEQTPCNPISPYGYTKLIGEQLAKQYAELFTINAVMLRYLNVYGERQHPHGPYSGAVAKFRHAFKTNQPITVFGDGSQTRDFVPVAQVVNANLGACMHAPELRSQIFNIGTGKTISILELLTQLQQEFRDYSETITFGAARTGDIQHSRVSCAKYRDVMKQFL